VQSRWLFVISRISRCLTTDLVHVPVSITRVRVCISCMSRLMEDPVDLFVTAADKVRRFFEPPMGTDIDGRRVIARTGALADGTPFFVGADMRPVEPLCSYFFEVQKRSKAKTMLDYAYDLAALADFLARLDPATDLASATEDELVAYRDFRTRDQDRPVSPATWARNRAAINGFYDWLVDSGRLAGRPYRKRRGGRDVLFWGATKDLDVRHLTHAQWRHLHQVGLGGYLPDGGIDPRFRGADPLRNMVAAELSVTTGMRLQEFSSLLDIEVGPPRRDGSAAEVRVQATAKRSLPRVVLIQHGVLRSIDLYRRTERAAAITRSAAALARQRQHLFVVTDVDTTRMKLAGQLHGRQRVFAVASMPYGLRRITVIDGEHGLEPMALFVGRGGRMVGKSRWEQIFSDASGRAVRLAELAGVVMPKMVHIHDLRHTFAVYMLQIFTRQLIEEGRETAYLSQHVSKNPLLTVQRLLGHRSPASTMKYLRYIEDTDAIVQRALAEWTDADKGFADYAADVAGRSVR
jgi:integrase